MTVKVVVVVRRAEGLSRDEFIQRWIDEHPAFVRRLPGVRGYRQSLAIQHRRAWPFDGMAEIEFDSVGSVARAFDSDEAKALFAHENHFIGSLDWFISHEAIVVPLEEAEGDPAWRSSASPI
ncbi:EthD family reductase [Microbacterium sp. 179-B 1A2 NHS]|uniref:EthD family reductase n=1 Tax=Microbacterium sp. 179-B 1A2 NHS TaxID=3142383 RepID=UPI00399F0B2D